MYPLICPLSLACVLLRLVGLKEYWLGTQSLGLDWALSEVGTGLEQQTCLSPHHLIIRACLLGLETKNKQYITIYLETATSLYMNLIVTLVINHI